jgi:hypothetical protein
MGSNSALKALGFGQLPECGIFEHKHTKLGTVSSENDEGTITLVGIQAPAEFWEATITAQSGKVYKVSTGSGHINNYMEAFDAIARDDLGDERVVLLLSEDMLQIEEATGVTQ